MSPFAHKPTITGERVVLRPLVAADADDMWHDLQDAESNRLTGTHGGFQREQIDDWCATRAGHDDRLDLAVIERATGKWAGEAVINEWDPDNHTCSFRIALAANARDRGLGSEATQLIVDYVFDQPVVNRLELEVFAFNPRAIAVYERLGFVREGVRRQALKWDNEFIDAVMMSIVRTDRPASPNRSVELLPLQRHHDPKHASTCHVRWLPRRERQMGTPSYDDAWYAEQCGGCVHWLPIAGVLGTDWGICSNAEAHADGQLRYEHDGCVSHEPAPQWVTP